MKIPVFKTPKLFGAINGFYAIIAPIFKLKPRNWQGFATPLCVLVKQKEQKLIKHEKKHVEQWWRYIIILFPVLYLYEVLRYGYDYAPLEIEAKLAEYKSD